MGANKVLKGQTKEKFTVAVDKIALEQFRDVCKANAISQSGKVEQMIQNFNKRMSSKNRESAQVESIVKKIGKLLDKKLNILRVQEPVYPAPQRIIQTNESIPRIQDLQDSKRLASIPKRALQREQSKSDVAATKENELQRRINSGHVPTISELTDLAHYRRQRLGR